MRNEEWLWRRTGWEAPPFIDCKPPLFRGEGDRVSGGGVSGRMGHKGGGLASLRSSTGLWVLRTGGIRWNGGFAAGWMPQNG